MRNNIDYYKLDIDELFIRYQNGERIKDLSSEVKMAPNTLTCIFKRIGLKKAYRSPNSHIPYEEIYNKHHQGVLYKELCDEYGISYKNLTYGLKHFQHPTDKDLVIRVELGPLWERYLAGEQLKEIAEEVGLSPKELSRRFSVNGYKKDHEIDKYSFDDIEQLRIELGTLSAVAEKLHLSKESLKRWYYDRDLSVRGYKLKDENFFEEINTPAKAYFLGFIYADGYLNDKGHFFRIKINSRDKNILSHLANILYGPEKTIPEWIEDGKTVCAISIANHKMTNDLKKWGVHQKKSMTIQFPKDIPNDLIRHFIRGFFDGDGSVSIVKPGVFGNIIRVSFYCASETFIKYVSELFINSGFHPQKISKSINCYYLTLARKEEMLKFRDYLYFDVDNELYLERKYQKFQNIDERIK